MKTPSRHTQEEFTRRKEPYFIEAKSRSIKNKNSFKSQSKFSLLLSLPPFLPFLCLLFTHFPSMVIQFVSNPFFVQMNFLNSTRSWSSVPGWSSQTPFPCHLTEPRPPESSTILSVTQLQAFWKWSDWTSPASGLVFLSQVSTQCPISYDWRSKNMLENMATRVCSYTWRMGWPGRRTVLRFSGGCVLQKTSTTHLQSPLPSWSSLLGEFNDAIILPSALPFSNRNANRDKSRHPALLLSYRYSAPGWYFLPGETWSWEW